MAEMQFKYHCLLDFIHKQIYGPFLCPINDSFFKNLQTILLGTFPFFPNRQIAEASPSFPHVFFKTHRFAVENREQRKARKPVLFIIRILFIKHAKFS